MIRQSLVVVTLLALFLVGGTVTVAADPWKDESGHGHHKHKYKRKHHKHYNHHRHDDKERVVVIEPQQVPPPEPHIGVQVETGNVSVGGRIRTNR